MAAMLLAAQMPSFAEKMITGKTKKTAGKTVKLKKRTDVAVPFTKKDRTIAPLKLKISDPVRLKAPVGITSRETEKPQKPEEDKKGLAIGIKGGSSAGLRGAVGDISYSLDSLIPGAEIRGGLGYLTGAPANSANQLKMATVNLDAVYNITEGEKGALPVNVYVGGGFIYPWKVSSNLGKGAWGAHAYLGSKYLLEDNAAIFGELSYTGIKYQADQTALRGVDMMMGYSYSF